MTIVEFFSGIGSQAKALKNIGIDINSNWEQEIAIKILDMYLTI